MLVWNMALSLLTSAKLPIVFSRSAKEEKFVDQVKTLWKEYNVKLSWGFQLNCRLTITTNTFYSILLRLKVVKTLRTMIMLNKNKMKGFECVLWFVTNSQIMTYFTISYNRLSIGRKIIIAHFMLKLFGFVTWLCQIWLPWKNPWIFHFPLKMAKIKYQKISNLVSQTSCWLWKDINKKPNLDKTIWGQHRRDNIGKSLLFFVDNLQPMSHKQFHNVLQNTCSGRW